jgi:hypothetical protein
VNTGVAQRADNVQCIALVVFDEAGQNFREKNEQNSSASPRVSNHARSWG